MSSLSVKDIAVLVKGTIIGDEDLSITGVSKIDSAVPGSLAFLANPKYETHLSTTEAGAVLVNPEIAIPSQSGVTFITVDDPYLSFCKVLNKYFNPDKLKTGISEKAIIDDSVVLGKDVYIGDYVVIGEGCVIGDETSIYPNTFIGENVHIGNDAIIYSGTNIYRESVLGNNVILHSGTVVGSDGFGHAPQKDGTYMKIPQIGNVIIEDDVEIGSNCSIDRATMGSTIIRKGVKLDNLIQVAHNVEIGENTVIAGQSGVSGSTLIGKNCVVGGQVGFAGHLKIANGTLIGAQSGLGKDVVEPNTKLFGTPVLPLRDALRTQVIIRNLPDLKEKVDRIEDELNSQKEE